MNQPTQIIELRCILADRERVIFETPPLGYGRTWMMTGPPGEDRVGDRIRVTIERGIV